MPGATANFQSIYLHSLKNCTLQCCPYLGEKKITQWYLVWNSFLFCNSNSHPTHAHFFKDKRAGKRTQMSLLYVLSVLFCMFLSLYLKICNQKGQKRSLEVSEKLASFYSCRKRLEPGCWWQREPVASWIIRFPDLHLWTHFPASTDKLGMQDTESLSLAILCTSLWHLETAEPGLNNSRFIFSVKFWFKLDSLTNLEKIAYIT